MSIPLPKIHGQATQTSIPLQTDTPKVQIISLIALGILSSAVAVYAANFLVALPITVVALTATSGLVSLVSFIAAIYIGFISPKKMLNNKLEEELKNIESWYNEAKKSIEDHYSAEIQNIITSNTDLFGKKKIEIENLFEESPTLKNFKEAKVGLEEIKHLLQINLQELEQITEKIESLQKVKEKEQDLQAAEKGLSTLLIEKKDCLVQTRKLKALTDQATQGFAPSRKDNREAMIAGLEKTIQDLEREKAPITTLIKSLEELPTLQAKTLQLIANIKRLEEEQNSAMHAYSKLESAYASEARELQTSIKKLQKMAHEDSRITIEYAEKRLKNALHELSQKKQKTIENAKISLMI